VATDTGRLIEQWPQALFQRERCPKQRGTARNQLGCGFEIVVFLPESHYRQNRANRYKRGNERKDNSRSTVRGLSHLLCSNLLTTVLERTESRQLNHGTIWIATDAPSYCYPDMSGIRRHRDAVQMTAAEADSVQSNFADCDYAPILSKTDNSVIAPIHDVEICAAGDSCVAGKICARALRYCRCDVYWQIEDGGHYTARMSHLERFADASKL
jgi:hypothetical protein